MGLLLILFYYQYSEIQATASKLKSELAKGNRLAEEQVAYYKDMFEKYVKAMNILFEAGKNCVDNGILVISAGPNTVRFIPPLIVGTEEIDMAVEAVGSALQA